MFSMSVQGYIPAFCIRMSRRPKRPSAAAITLSAASFSLISAATKAQGPIAARRRAVASPAAASASAMIADAPSSRNRSAIPAPMPRAAPITTATLPFSLSPKPHPRSEEAPTDCRLQRVEKHRGEHQPALDHLRVMRRHAHHVDGGLDGGEKQHAGEDAGQPAVAALQAYAADDHGGKSLEQHADAEIGGGAGSAGSEQPSGE